MKSTLLTLGFLVCFAQAWGEDITVSPQTFTGTQTVGTATTGNIATQGTVTVASGANVTFVANNSITLTPGFTASGLFRAYIYIPPGPPTVATAATATPSPVTGTTTVLSALGADNGGEAALIYTWATTGTPPASVAFSANGTNAAKSSTATFTKSGTYTFQVTIKDADNLTVTSNVIVDVTQAATSLVMNPTSASVSQRSATAFVGTMRDQFAAPLLTQPLLSWTTTGGGVLLAPNSMVIEASGSDIWSTSDGFRFAHQSLTGDGTITAKVESLVNTDNWSKAGVMMRDGLAANAVNAMTNVTAAAGALFQRRTTVGGVSVNTIIAGQAAPKWVRLQRVGNTFTGSYSVDGAVWTVIASETITMSPTVYIGLASTAHNTARLTQAVFSNVTVTTPSTTPVAPDSPWVQQDVGAVVLTGSSSYTPSTKRFTLTGAGTDIWNNADGFRFVHQPMTGDATLVARVVSLQNTDAWAKAGLMIRDGLAPGARNAMVNVTAASGALFQRRVATDGISVNTIIAGQAAPKWVKITRSGNLFTGYYSNDGITWTLIASESITMGATVNVGMAVTSHTTAALTTGVFENVCVYQGAGSLAIPLSPWRNQDIGTTIPAGSTRVAVIPGVFLADAAPGGPFTLTASASSRSATSSVTVVNAVPTVVVAANATPSPVTGNTTALKVVGGDDAGEQGLTYTWATTGTPPASVTFSANGTNAAKSSTATFTKAGTYAFQVTITDAGNLSVTSAVTVTVITAPTVASTTAVSAITGTTASGGGNVTADGGSAVTARGVCWGTAVNPLVSGSKTTDGTGTGTFTSAITGLSMATLYHVRAYATNSVGTSYGPGITFITLGIAPTITTQPASLSRVVGQTATFNVVATGTPTLTYQWRKGGVAISGATLATYTTPVLVIGDNGGIFSVVVSNGVNPAATSANATLTVTAASAPTISTLSPTSGTTAGGTTVTLTGTNLTGASAVTFGGTAATSVTVVSATSVTCVTPAKVAGAVDVVVTTPGGTGTKTAGYTYVVPALTVAWTAASQSSVGESGTLTVTAQLSAASGQIVSVPFTVTGTSVGTDRTISASPITIAVGATTGTATITITADTLDEVNETVILTMGTPTNATLGATTVHTATITDDDATPTVVWTAASQSSVGESGTLTVTAQLSVVSGQIVSVPFTVTGTSVGTDRTITASPITIAAGATTGTATITITADTLDEANESVILTLGAPTNATLGATTVHTATITDDDATPTVAWTAASQSSVGETGALTVTAQLSAASGQSVTVPFTVTGTSAGTDRTITASPITIAAGATTGTATITITADTLDELNETVILTIGAPTNATLGATTVHTATITDDDATPTVVWTAASQSSVGETGTMTVTAQLSAASGQSVTVPFTVTGTATGTDYTITASPITIAAGGTTGTATITITADTLDELNETVILTIGTPTNATLGVTTVHTATITDDDDATPTVVWTAATSVVGESDATASLSVLLSSSTDKNVTVTYTATGGTATGSGTDYYLPTGTITIPAGSTSATIPVTIRDDSDVESNETVVVTLSAPVNAILGTPAVHTLTINDNDAVTVVISASDATFSENGIDYASIILTRTGATTAALSVPITFTGTAVAADYTQPPSPVSIPAGVASVSLPIFAKQDTLQEPTETVIVTVGSGTGYAVGAPNNVTLQILDDDVVTITATTPTALEKATPTAGVFTVTRAGSTTAALTVNVALSGTAVTGDYSRSWTGTTIIIPAGALSITATITPMNDATSEGNESVIATLQTGTTYSVGVASEATVTIIDDEVPTVSIAATDASASEPGSDTATFTVTRSLVATTALTVNYTLSGTATNGVDYVSLTGTATIPANATSTTFTVTPLGDIVTEVDETVIVRIAENVIYGVTGSASATATIRDCTLTIAVSDAMTLEPNGVNSVFTITRTGSTTAALTVAVAWVGSATPVTDFTTTPATTTSVTIAAGSATRTITLAPVGDSLLEGTESAVLSLVPSAIYAIGSSATASVSIGDATITLTASGSTLNEETGQSVTITATRTGYSTTALSIPVSFSGTAEVTTDYTRDPATGALSLAAGNTSANLYLYPRTNDNNYRAEKTVISSIAAPVNYALVNASATVTVVDNDGTVSLSVSDADVNETGANAGTITLSRTGSTTAALTVSLTRGGSATKTTDYTTTPATIASSSTATSTVTIPVGQESLAIAITPVDDSVTEPDENVTLTIEPSSAYRIGSASAGISITDNDTPSVTITATSASATEGGALGVFVVERSGNPNTAITIPLTITGTAASVTDYTALAASVTLDAQITSKEIYLTALADLLVENNETVIVTLGTGTGYTLGVNKVATVNIIDANRPTISIATTTNAAEGSTPVAGKIRITRTGPTTSTLAVPITVTGSATVTTDYTRTPTGSTVTLAVNAAFADITVTPVNDALVEGDETVIVTVNAGNYDITGDTAATLTIGDDERPTISIVATDGEAREAALNPATFTVTRSAASASALTIPLTIDGSATAGVDYVALAASAIIPANLTSVIVTITPRDDAEVEGAESINLTLGTGANYDLAAIATSATATLYSDDLPAPVITYQIGTNLVVEATGPVASYLGITDLIATTTTPNVTLTPSLTSGGFVLRASLATAGITSAPVTLRFRDERGVLGPQSTASLRWATGGGTVDNGDPDSAPLPPPTVTLTIADASLTGDKRGTLKGKQVAFTNTGGEATTPVSVNVSAKSYGGIIQSITVTSSDGQEKTINGSSGTASFVFPNDGIYTLSANAVAKRNDLLAYGQTAKEELLVVDRKKPQFQLIADNKFWSDPSKPLIIPFWEDLYLNNNEETGYAGNKVQRENYRMNVFKASDFSVDLAAIGDLSGILKSETPKITITSDVSGKRDVQSLPLTDENGDVIGWELSGLDNSEETNAIFQALVKDRCGNEGEYYQGIRIENSKIHEITINEESSPARQLLTPLNDSTFAGEVFQGVPSKSNAMIYNSVISGHIINRPLTIGASIVSQDFHIRRYGFGNIDILRVKFKRKTASHKDEIVKDFYYAQDIPSMPGYTDKITMSWLYYDYDRDGNSITKSATANFTMSPASFFQHETVKRYAYSGSIAEYNKRLESTTYTVGTSTSAFSAYAYDDNNNYRTYDADDWTLSETYKNTYEAYPLFSGSGSNGRSDPPIITIPAKHNVNEVDWVDIRITDPGLPLVKPAHSYLYLGISGLGADSIALNGDEMTGKIKAKSLYESDLSYGLMTADWRLMPYGDDDPTKNERERGVSAEWFNSIRIINANDSVLSTGSIAELTIPSSYVGFDFRHQDFNNSGDYIRFFNEEGQDITAPINSLPLDDSEKIKIIHQQLKEGVAYRPEYEYGISDQNYEVVIQVGSKVKPGLYDVDVKLGEVHAASTKLGKQYAGKNGAHRMIEALAIVKIGVEDKDGIEIGPATGISNPHPTVTIDAMSSGDVVIGAKTATFTLKGSVYDPIADIVEGHAADITTVDYNGQTYPVKRVNDDRGNDPLLRPYGFKGTFSIPVEIPFMHGDTLVEVVAKNSIGNIGGDGVSVRMKLNLTGPSDTASMLPTVATFPGSLLFPASISNTVKETIIFIRDVTNENVTLIETSASSGRFEGKDAANIPYVLLVPWEIDLSVSVAERIIVDWSVAGAPASTLELLETGVNTKLFRGTQYLPASVVGDAEEQMTVTVTSLEIIPEDGSDEGIINPLVVRYEQPDAIQDKPTQGSIQGQSIPLKVDESDAKKLRFDRPLMFVQQAVPSGVANIVSVGNMGSDSEKTRIKVGDHERPLTMGAAVNKKGATVKRARGTAVDTKFVLRGSWPFEDKKDLSKAIWTLEKDGTSIEIKDIKRDGEPRSETKFWRTYYEQNFIGLVTVPPQSPLGNYKLKVTVDNEEFDFGLSVEIVNPTIMLLCLDGVNGDILKQTIATGAPEIDVFTKIFGKNFERSVLPGQGANKGIAINSLPTITWSSWATIFTGKDPVEHGVLGNSFFRRDVPNSRPVYSANAERFGDLKNHIGAAFLGLSEHLTKAEVATAPPSLYKLIENISPSEMSTVSVHTWYSNNEADREMRFGTTLETGATKHSQEGATIADTETADRAVRRLRWIRQMPNLMGIYFPGPDNYAHAVGRLSGEANSPEHSLRASRKHLESVTNQQLKRVYDEVEKRGHLESTIWMVVSDHGLMGSKREEIDWLQGQKYTKNHFSIRESMTAKVDLPTITVKGKTYTQEVSQTIYRDELKKYFDKVLGNARTWLGEKESTLWSKVINEDEKKHLVYSPNGGLGHIYLRGNGGDFSTPPTSGNGSDLYKLAWQLARGAKGLPDETGTVLLPEFNGALGGASYPAAVLVREGTQFKVFVPDAQYGFGRPLSLSILGGETRKWVLFEQRLKEMAGEKVAGSRTGDIVLLFDIEKDFITVNDDKEEELNGWHGSPTMAESRTPFIIGFSSLEQRRKENAILENVINQAVPVDGQGIPNKQVTPTVVDIMKGLIGK